MKKHLVRFIFMAILGFIFSLGIDKLAFVKAEISNQNHIPIVLNQKNSNKNLEGNSTLELIQTAKQYYDGGEYTNAVQLLEQVAEIYQNQGNLAKQAQTLSFLALATQKLGDWQAAEKAINLSLSLLEKLPKQKQSNQISAQVYNSQGHLQLAQGKVEAALETWQNAELIYQQIGDTFGVIGSQINQAQALQSLGLYRQAEKKITQVQQKLASEPDSLLKLTALHNLGNIYRLTGDLQAALDILNQSLAITKKQALKSEESQILLSLGNTELALALRAEHTNNKQEVNSHWQLALNYYQQAANSATLPLTKTQAKLNQLNLFITTKELTSAYQLLPSIINSFEPLNPSRPAIFARINLAQNLMKIEPENAMIQTYNLPDISQILSTAVTQARSIQDQKAESYALGTLGKWYEKQQKWAKAREMTESALILAQGINASELAYQWQWQMGRLWQNSQANDEAITYYTQAFNLLNELRGDLVALNPEIQFSFRDSVEPVYRQLADLLLRSPTKAHLSQARQVMESLQLAELDNFFRDACAQPEAIDIDNLDPHAAVIYPIILPERLEIIVKLPGNDNLHHYSHENVSETEINNTVSNLQEYLRKPSTSQRLVKNEAQKLYDWLIRPFETDLELTTNRDRSQIKTLVFVLDGALRNLPMSALYDGKQYLVERYAVAVTPGLQLIEPSSVQKRSVGVLVAGATDAPSFQQEGLTPLDNVALEIEEVQKQVKDSYQLSNQDFTEENLQTQITTTPFTIVHLATHGKFSSNPEQTFILDWQKRIKVKDFDNLLRPSDLKTVKSVDLLILSACETAKGDQRAALGLAGVAIRAGASSTLATLWQVNDASTAEFMIRFYQQLNNPQLTKAEALRNVQLAFLHEYETTDFERPYYWASLILIGNWL